MISALVNAPFDIQLNSYNMIKKEITTSTSSMTSIPKPLKFLIPHYNTIREFYTKLESTNKLKILIADLLAILTLVTPNVKETSLSYVLAGTKNDITSWGQEFIK
jgi:26S proteasome regulatory subunit N1